MKDGFALDLNNDHYFDSAHRSDSMNRLANRSVFRMNATGGPSMNRSIHQSRSVGC